MTKGTRETWRDWLPPGHPEPPLITRRELLDTLARRGLGVSESTLRYWEREDALPTPVRRSHEGTVQVLYPAWYAEVVAAMPRPLTGRGPLARLRPQVRARFEEAAQQAGRVESGRGSHPLLPAGIVAALQRMMAELNARGTTVEAAEVRLLRPGEPPLSYTLPARPPDPNEGREG